VKPARIEGGKQTDGKRQGNVDSEKDFIPPFDARAGSDAFLHKVLFFSEKNAESRHKNQENRKEKPALPVIQPARQREDCDPNSDNTDKGAYHHPSAGKLLFCPGFCVLHFIFSGLSKQPRNG
jgi:hypothetical protein